MKHLGYIGGYLWIPYLTEKDSGGTLQNPASNSYPYVRHLVASPDEGLLAWTRFGNGDTYEVVVFSTKSDEIISIYKESPLYPIEASAFFLGNKRMLVTAKKKGDTEYSYDAQLTLVDTASEKILSQVKIPNCSLNSGTSDIKTGRFIGDDRFRLTSVNSDNDQLIWKEIDVGQMTASPIFGLNGRIYYRPTSGGIYATDGETKTEIGKGDNCMYYDAQTNLLYAGGGYEDHSGDSFLHVISPAGTKSIPFGDDPIEGIKPAGDDMLLLSSLGYSGSYYNPSMPRLHYDRKATVVLFDWKSEKRVWQIDIPDIYISRIYSDDPVLLSNPEEGWALIQTGSFIKQISIKTGEVINTIPKQVNEIIEAVWIPSAHSIYIARRLDIWPEKEGTVEQYQMP